MAGPRNRRVRCLLTAAGVMAKAAVAFGGLASHKTRLAMRSRGFIVFMNLPFLNCISPVAELAAAARKQPKFLVIAPRLDRICAADLQKCNQ